MKGIFAGREGIRAGWRLLLFLAISLAIGSTTGTLIVKLLHLQPAREWTATEFLIDETFGGLGIVATLAAAAVMSRIERRRFADYGLPFRPAFGALFWEGALWGLAAVSLLFGLIAAFGGVWVGGLALHGAALARSALLWAAAWVLVGLSEEFLFRGYPQAALTDGMGFWPAAVLLSLVFGALHYFLKAGETVTDGVSVTLIGLFVAFTLRRTGSLWFAIGFHAAFDFAAITLYGAPNSGNGGRPIADRLLSTSFHEPDWVTGGRCGMEASALVFVPIALLFLLFARRHRRIRFPAGG
jgi:membrane protease YdiL (CAAX protease family)